VAPGGRSYFARARCASSCRRHKCVIFPTIRLRVDSGMTSSTHIFPTSSGSRSRIDDDLYDLAGQRMQDKALGLALPDLERGLELTRSELNGHHFALHGGGGGGRSRSRRCGWKGSEGYRRRQGLRGRAKDRSRTGGQRRREVASGAFGRGGRRPRRTASRDQGHEPERGQGVLRGGHEFDLITPRYPRRALVGF